MNPPDLNLLITLDALLAEGSVAGAARRLQLSPSAMSRALARLRKVTGDPLLVRAGRGLIPTPRALALRGPVSQLVQEAHSVLRPAAALALGELTRTFTLRVSDGFVDNFGPALLAHVGAQAPGVRLSFVQKTDKDSAPLLVQYVKSDILRQILPILVIGIGLYFLLMPKLGESDRQQRLYGLPFALVAGGCVGFYDGFFGPGAGSFYALAFVTLMGFNLAKSTAHAKVLNATSNVGGLLLFIIGGKVIWATGFVMMVGQFFGARARLRHRCADLARGGCADRALAALARVLQA